MSTISVFLTYEKKLSFVLQLFKHNLLTEEESKELLLDEDEGYFPKEFTHIPEKLSRKRVLSYGTLYFVKWQVVDLLK